LNPVFHREDWKGARYYTFAHAKDGDIILQAFPEPFAGYRWYQGDNDVRAYGATKKLGQVIMKYKSILVSLLNHLILTECITSDI